MKLTELASLAENNLKTSAGVLKDFRSTHLELFKKHGLKSNDEAYRFTKLETFLDLTGATEEFNQLDQSENYIDLVVKEGVITSSPQIPGLSIKPLESELSQLKLEHPLAELQLALTSGVEIEIAKNTKLPKPLRVRQLAHAPALVIKLGTHAEACLLEESTSSLQLGMTVVQLEAGAQCEHIQLSTGNETSFNHADTQVSLKKDAKYRHVVLHLSGKLNRRNVNIDLLESGAHAESYNLYLTDKTEHSDISTQIQHKAADTTSDQIAKGILDGESKGIFTGKIHIHPKAQRVASGQLNKNLLLSKKSQAHSQPQLEIFADDVKCSHGSTTGQLSPEEVFYFQARGIPAEKARTLLAHGFGLEIVMKIENQTVRQQIEELVLKALEQKFQLGVTP
jgi:Fe-S cluster assembly protein SufD